MADPATLRALLDEVRRRYGDNGDRIDDRMRGYLRDLEGYPPAVFADWVLLVRIAALLEAKLMEADHDA